MSLACAAGEVVEGDLGPVDSDLPGHVVHRSGGPGTEDSSARAEVRPRAARSLLERPRPERSRTGGVVVGRVRLDTARRVSSSPRGITSPEQQGSRPESCRYPAARSMASRRTAKSSGLVRAYRKSRGRQANPRRSQSTNLVLSGRHEPASTADPTARTPSSAMAASRDVICSNRKRLIMPSYSGTLSNVQITPAANRSDRRPRAGACRIHSDRQISSRRTHHAEANPPEPAPSPRVAHTVIGPAHSRNRSAIPSAPAFHRSVTSSECTDFHCLSACHSEFVTHGEILKPGRAFHK